MGESSVGLSFEKLLEERRHARIVGLAEPEDRLLPELAVGLVPGDIEQDLQRALYRLA